MDGGERQMDVANIMENFLPRRLRENSELDELSHAVCEPRALQAGAGYPSTTALRGTEEQDNRAAFPRCLSMGTNPASGKSLDSSESPGHHGLRPLSDRRCSLPVALDQPKLFVRRKSLANWAAARDEFMELDSKRCKSDRMITFDDAPSSTPAAALILDVSGFSALCAKYTAEGTAGCEGFSLIVSEYLARLVDVVESFGGDVEAFAGDALICMFFAKEASSASICIRRPSEEVAGPSHNASDSLRFAAVLVRLSPYMHYPPSVSGLCLASTEACFDPPPLPRENAPWLSTLVIKCSDQHFCLMPHVDAANPRQPAVQRKPWRTTALLSRFQTLQ